MISYSLKNENVKLFYDIEKSTKGFGTYFIINNERIQGNDIDYIIINRIKIETCNPNIFIYNDGKVVIIPDKERSSYGSVNIDFNEINEISKDVILNMSVEKLISSYAVIIDVKD